MTNHTSASLTASLQISRSEIQLSYRDEMLERGTVVQKLADKTLNNGERNKLEKRLARLDEEMEQMKQDLADANKRAQQEREALDRVPQPHTAFFSR